RIDIVMSMHSAGLPSGGANASIWISPAGGALVSTFGSMLRWLASDGNLVAQLDPSSGAPGGTHTTSYIRGVGPHVVLLERMFCPGLPPGGCDGATGDEVLWQVDAGTLLTLHPMEIADRDFYPQGDWVPPAATLVFSADERWLLTTRNGLTRFDTVSG